MSFTQILYQLFLSPLTLIFEAVYSTAFLILRNSGAAIFPLSLAVNLLLLPFYNRADAIQAEEHDRTVKMEPFVTHIKKTFKGDERFMMLQAYYRENNYKPIYAVRSSIALILEVPFFIAAYNFLSNLPDLQGARFTILTDLSQPDKLIMLGSFGVNVLPILMTVINIISSEIYTKGQKFKDKIMLYVMALLFLVVLYDSPSGLVLYWTLNNLFSLIKNIVNATKNKLRTSGYFFSLAGIGVIIYNLVSYKGPINYRLTIYAVAALLQIPLVLSLIPKSFKKTISLSEAKKPSAKLFFGGALFLAIVVGALIPSAVIKSSVAEFVLSSAVHSPVRYVIYATLTAISLYVIWFGLFYALASQKVKRVFCLVIWICAIIGIVNYMAFGENSNSLTQDLRFEVSQSIPFSRQILNLAVILGISVMVALVFKFNKEHLITFISPVLLIAVAAMAGSNVYQIQKEMPEIRRVIEESTEDGKPVLTFSQDKQNVVVLMLDRSISEYVPYMMQENPDLAAQFSGFTYYPNTLSYGTRTLVAAPALFGGYDYTPVNTNKRSDLSLETKHNQALLTMPVLFSEAGYDVTVMDPPYAGYSQVPDLSIYDPYPEIKAYNTEFGQFRTSSDIQDRIQDTWKRNFFCYGFMKVCPLFMQTAVYSTGVYFEPGTSSTALIQSGNIDHYAVPNALMDSFLNSYEVLKALPSISTSAPSENGSFILMQNSTTHNIIPLQEPSYEPVSIVDNAEYDQAHSDRFTIGDHSIKMETTYQYAHYQSNMAAFLQLGKWFDELRELGVYDNTRIIIVSDHGWGLEQDPDMVFGKQSSDSIYNPYDAMGYNPILLVKDFNAEGDFATDYTFMTNADTPYLATDGVLDNPISPFTNTPLYQPEAKLADKQYILYTDNWSPNANSGNKFTNTIWFSCAKQDMLDRENWKKEDKEP